MNKKYKRDFSEFFTQASAREKSDLLKQVVREANQDQKRLMDEVERTLKEKETVKV